MLLSIIKNPWVLMAICTLVVFFEMFLVKKWYISITKKIKNAKVRTALNVVLVLGTFFALSMCQMFALCDVLGAAYSWVSVIAATLGATLIYLVLEKIFGNAEINALGTAFCEFISHSDMFDGKITKDGVIAVAEKLLSITNKIDNAAATKEAKAINEVVKRLDGFLADGKVTEEERAEAQELIGDNGIDVNSSTYERFKALLNK
jgi:hypothetical protein